MDSVGRIIGDGYGKGWLDGRRCRFPAVAAPVSEVGYENDAGEPFGMSDVEVAR